MSTDLSTRPDSSLPDNVLEGVVVGGDLSRLSATQRLAWYKARCDAAGLDPRTQPFQYLSLQGKLSLYATKSATDQLINSRKLTVEIMNRHHDRDLGIFEVHCRVSFPDGHHVEDFAAVSVKSLQGDALCNALMKGITKSKRRTVLSACGLGMLDETEVDTIPLATRVEMSQDGQIALPPPAAPPMASTKEARRFESQANDFCRRMNAAWIDKHTGPDGVIPSWVKDLISPFQLVNHMLKRANIALPEGGKFNDRMRTAASIWLSNEKATVAEWKSYVKELADELTKANAGADESGEAATVAADREPGSDDE